MPAANRILRGLAYLRDTLWTYMLVVANRLRGGWIRVGRGARIAWGARVWGRVELGDYSYIGPGSDVKGRVVIGTGTRLNGENYVRAGPGDDCAIVIGSYNAIAPRASFFVRDHDLQAVPIQTQLRNMLGLREGFSCKGSMIVGSDVWIGFGAIILGKVRIGNGAVVGAMSVVTKDVDPYSIVAGSPARKIGERLPREVAECIEKSKWWEMEPGEELRRVLEELEEYVRRALSSEKSGEKVECPAEGRQG